MASQYDLPYTGNQVEALLAKVSELEADMPSKTSDLTNDSGFITSADVPTKISDLTNDSGFITNAPVAAEAARAQAAEALLATIASLQAEITRATGVEGTLQDLIDGIAAKIPSAATSQNQLADKAFVNSSIATSTAEFRGTFDTLAELQATAADENDYGYVRATDAAGNTIFKRYKYAAGSWVFEYDLNNSSFTSAQWAAINSAITASLVEKLRALPTNAELQEALNGKYVKPSGGIPKSDLANAVQASLNKADTAIQQHQDIRGKADITALESGEVVPALAEDIASWKGNNSLVEDTWSDVIRTTAGSVSIVTAAGGKIKSIVAKSLIFSATAMRAEGLNRLHYATALGSGYYFMVPALPFGIFGTAIEPNGILFTNSAGVNLRPTVRFKRLTDGVPTSLSDGAACTYVDSSTYRFYTCSEPGYMIVSGITLADTCAHIAWSSRYDEFVSPTAAGDAGTVVSLTALLTAVHSYGQLLCVGGKADGIIWTDDTHYTWTRNNDRITPTWSTVENEDGTYTHIATISTMLSDGAAVLPDGTPLAVEGVTVSYTDDSATAPAGYIYFNLATPVTGAGTASRNAAMEDWGVEVVVGANGEAYITTMYYRGVADTVRAWVAGEMDGAFAVIAQLFAHVNGRVDTLYEQIAEGLRSLTVDELTIRNSLTRYDNSGNRDIESDVAPNTMADFVGQFWHHKDNKHDDWYFATGTTAVSQWRKITLA